MREAFAFKEQALGLGTALFLVSTAIGQRWIEAAIGAFLLFWLIAQGLLRPRLATAASFFGLLLVVSLALGFHGFLTPPAHIGLGIVTGACLGAIAQRFLPAEGSLVSAVTAAGLALLLWTAALTGASVAHERGVALAVALLAAAWLWFFCHRSRYSLKDWVDHVGLCLLLAVGAVTLLGWALGSRDLARLGSAGIALPVSAGLCALLGGVSLLGLMRQERAQAGRAAIGVAFVAVLSLMAAQSFPALVQIDARVVAGRQVLVGSAWVMSQPLSLAILASACWIGVLSVMPERALGWRISWICGLAMAMLGLAGAVSQAFNLDTFSLRQMGAPMTLGGVVAVLAFGIGLMQVSSVRLRRWEKTRSWYPGLVALGVCLTTIFLWSAVADQQQRLDREQNQVVASRVVDAIKSDLGAQMERATGLMQRLRSNPGAWNSGPALQALLVSYALPMRASAIVVGDGTDAGQRVYVGQETVSAAQWAAAWAALPVHYNRPRGNQPAVALHTVTLPGPLGEGFLIHVFDGYGSNYHLGAFFVYDVYLRPLLDGVPPQFDVLIQVNQRMVSGARSGSGEWSPVSERFQTGPLQWDVRVTLAPDAPWAFSRQLPWVVLCAGLLLALLLAIALRLAEVARARSVEAELSQLNLELESAVRLAAERELLAAREAGAAVLEKMSDAVFTVDCQWRFTFLNKSAQGLLQASESSLLGAPLFERFKISQGDDFESRCRMVLATGETQAFECYSPSLRRWVAGRVYPHGDGLTVLFHDITAARRAEVFERKLRTVLSSVATGRSLHESLTQLVQMLEELHEGCLCAVTLYQAEGNALRVIAAPHLPQDYWGAIEGIRPGPLSISSGAAIHLRERVVTTDIAHDVRWAQLKELAAKHRLAACWAEPVFAPDGRVLGSVDVYHRETHAPAHEELVEVEAAAAIAGIAILRAEWLAKIEESEQRFRSLFEYHPDAVFAVDAQGLILACNASAHALLGTSEQSLLNGRYESLFTEPQQLQTRFKFEQAMRGQSVGYESACQLFGGRQKAVQVTHLPIVTNGQIAGIYSVLQDLTEIRAAQAKLLERDRFFLLSPVSFLIADPRGQVLQINDFLPRRLGGSAEEFVGRNIVEFLHLEDVAPTREAFALLVGAGGVREIRTRCRHRNGGFVWMEWNVMLADGGLVFATGRDVSEELRAQNDERILRRVVEESPAVLWRWAPHPGWPIIFVSSNVSQWGYAPADLTHKEVPYADLIHPEDYPGYLKYVQRNALEEDGERFAYVYRIRAKDGQWVWVDERAATVRNEDHSVRYWQGITLDVTQRQQALEVLHERDEFFRLIDEMLSILGPDGRFIQANDAFTHVLGFTPAEIMQTTWRELVCADDLAAAETAFEALTSEGRLSLFQARFRKKDRSYRWLEWNAYRQSNGQFYAVARDVTETRRVSAELQQALGDLKLRNQELQDFAFVASHDLQEPLRKIQAFSDRVLTRYGGQMDTQGVDYLQRMDNAARRMQTLIDDLLSYSRVSTRGQPFVDVDLHRTVREVLADLETLIEKTGAVVHVHDLPLVMADPTQMRQVFQNLIANALKFRSPDRRPELTLQSRRAGRAADQPHAGAERFIITVRDNGIGFDNAYREHIFAPFQRLHGRSEYEGTGIGLAIVRKIIERHGGTISASGNPGHGACFTIDLPTLVAESSPGGAGIASSG